MKTYGGTGSTWKLRPIYPQVKNLGTHWTRVWVDQSDGLDVTKKRKIPPLPQIKGQLPSSQAFILTKELPRLLAELQKKEKKWGLTMNV